MILRIAHYILYSLIFCTLHACGAIIKSHGYVPPVEDVQQIQLGLDDKSSVAETLGSPLSAGGVIDEKEWYYIQSTFHHSGLAEPVLAQRDILAIEFDENDVVENIDRLTLKDGRIVALNRRVTSKPVKGVGFWRQIGSSVGTVRAEDIF